jgi:hypothetical protein
MANCMMQFADSHGGLVASLFLTANARTNVLSENSHMVLSRGWLELKVA